MKNLDMEAKSEMSITPEAILDISEKNTNCNSNINSTEKNEDKIESNTQRIRAKNDDDSSRWAAFKKLGKFVLYFSAVAYVSMSLFSSSSFFHLFDDVFSSVAALISIFGVVLYGIFKDDPDILEEACPNLSKETIHNVEEGVEAIVSEKGEDKNDTNQQGIMNIIVTFAAAMNMTLNVTEESDTKGRWMGASALFFSGLSALLVLLAEKRGANQFQKCNEDLKERYKNMTHVKEFKKDSSRSSTLEEIIKLMTSVNEGQTRKNKHHEIPGLEQEVFAETKISAISKDPTTAGFNGIL